MILIFNFEKKLHFFYRNQLIHNQLLEINFKCLFQYLCLFLVFILL